LDAEVRDERNRRWDEPFGEVRLDGETVARILSLPGFADVRPEDFPPQLPLKGIIANDGRLRRFQRGDVIIRKGDYGNSLFVILEGSVAGLDSSVAEEAVLPDTTNRRKSWSQSLMQLFAHTRPPEYRAARPAERGGQRPPASMTDAPDESLRVDVDELAGRHGTFTLEAPQMFGELAALTRSPRTTSIFAAEDETLLFELRWQGLRDIREWSMPFKQRIDQLYHERGLAIRLQECPIFKNLTDSALDEIARDSLFETYGGFDWMHRFKSAMGRRGADQIIEQEQLIYEQGTHVDGMLLINNGFVRVTERVDQGERTIGYLSRNDTYGLDEIAQSQRSDSTIAAQAGLRAIGYVDIIRIPTYLIRKHVLPTLIPHIPSQGESADKSRDSEEMRQGLMDFFVDHRFINGEHAMVINLDRCVGCDDCVRACATAHDNNPRFARHGYTFENAMVVNACMHCTDAVCLIGCPTGAIHRLPDTGTVVIDDNICIGCETCANSCPYNNIRMVDIRDASGAFMLDRDGQTISRATKCDLCNTQLTGPACAEACPHDALTRINIRDTEKLLQWLR